jgi:hypothetical protein
MQSLSWRDSLHYWLAYAMVKLNRLQYDIFTPAELNDLLAPYFPRQISFPVPMGSGELTCVEGKLTLSATRNEITLTLLTNMVIQVLGNTIYRAHCVITLVAQPDYLPEQKKLQVTNVTIPSLHLINDEYALLKDTQYIIDKLLPVPVSRVTTLLSSPVKSALNLLSSGSLDTSINYLNLYIQGNKQRIVDYHRPQIEERIKHYLIEQELTHTLRDSSWRERLFSRLGQTVKVENEQLRFYF